MCCLYNVLATCQCRPTFSLLLLLFCYVRNKFFFLFFFFFFSFSSSFNLPLDFQLMTTVLANRNKSLDSRERCAALLLLPPTK